MDRGQRIVLKNDSGLRKVGGDLLHVGLCGFAMGALEVGEFHDFEVFRCRTAIGSISALLKQCAVGGKGMFAEGDDLFADDDVFLIGRGEEGKAIGLLLSRLVTDENDDLAHAGDLGLLNSLNLPHRVLIKAEVGLHEGVDDILGRL